MTCIVGIKKNGQVLLASDSLTVYQNVKLVNVSNDYKIYTFNNFSIAISGEGPVSEILESIQDSRMWEEANLHGRADCATLMEAFHEKFLEKIPEADTENLGYEFLIATKEKLFWAISEPSVFEIGDYWAAGSGSDFALGALSVLYSQIGHGITVEEAANSAVLAACRFNQDCQAPVDIRII